MDATRRILRRQQIDRQLALALRQEEPKGGWLRAIRESLGMSLEAYGRRLGVSRQAANQLEKAEATEAITVKRLRAAADALGCDLVVTIVPRQRLEDTVRQRGLAVAEQRALYLNHTMALEGQALPPDRLQRMVEKTAAELIARGDAALWE